MEVVAKLLVYFLRYIYPLRENMLLVLYALIHITIAIDLFMVVLSLLQPFLRMTKSMALHIFIGCVAL